LGGIICGVADAFRASSGWLPVDPNLGKPCRVIARGAVLLNAFRD
jgi:hypothetical protein